MRFDSHMRNRPPERIGPHRTDSCTARSGVDQYAMRRATPPRRDGRGYAAAPESHAVREPGRISDTDI